MNYRLYWLIIGKFKYSKKERDYEKSKPGSNDCQLLPEKKFKISIVGFISFLYKTFVLSIVLTILMLFSKRGLDDLLQQRKKRFDKSNRE